MKQKLLTLWLSIALIALAAAGSLAAQPGPQVTDGLLTAWLDARGEITIPDEVQEIAPDVFRKNNAVTKLDLNKVKTLGANACREMQKLAAFKAPELEVLGDSAFYQSGSRWSFGFCELVLPRARDFGDAALQSNFTSIRRYYLPKAERLGHNVFLTQAPTLFDLSAATTLQQIEPDAFPSQKPWRDSCYIALPDARTLALLAAADLPSKIKPVIVDFDRSTPTVTAQLKVPAGSLNDDIMNSIDVMASTPGRWASKDLHTPKSAA